MNTRSRDFTGAVFGKLTVSGRANPPVGKMGDRMWICRCDCGKEISRGSADLVSRARHCGCSFPRGQKSKSWIGYNGVSGSILCMIRKSAKKKGLKFNLTCKYLWAVYEKQKSLCAISGIPIQIRKISMSRCDAINSASVDRIDSKLGYVRGNVQWTSLAINYMKKNHSQKTFVDLCCLVANKNGKVSQCAFSTTQTAR